MASYRLNHPNGLFSEKYFSIKKIKYMNIFKKKNLVHDQQEFKKKNSLFSS